MDNFTKLKNISILFRILLIGFGLTGIAQPIKYKGYGKADWWKMNQYSNDIYILENKTFAFYDLNALLVGDKKLIKYTYKDTDGQNLWHFKSDKQFLISGVTFIDSLVDNNNLPPDDFHRRLLFSTEINLRFQNCQAPLLELSGIKNDYFLNWWDNKFSKIEFTGMQVGLYAENNRFHSFTSISGEYNGFYLNKIKSDRKKIKLEFINNVFKKGFIYMNDSSQHTILRFTNDSINGMFRLENSLSTKKLRGPTLKCYFDKAWLNGQFYVPYTGKKSAVYFTECVFGKDAKLTVMSFDTIYLNRCSVNHPLYLEFDKTSNPVYMSFVNMDLDNIQFNFTERVHLYFDSDLNQDYIISTYERLLAKFKKEGKPLSYKNVDISYQKYIASQNGLKGRCSAFFNKHWWNYGYNKEYIIYWTFIFLLLFYFVNYLFWGKMQKVYSIIPHTDQLKRKDEGKLRFFLRTQLGIFIYTAYIFFSLKVDFEKLKYKYSSILVLFFIQYITGLICLFFIANAILKL